MDDPPAKPDDSARPADRREQFTGMLEAWAARSRRGWSTDGAHYWFVRSDPDIRGWDDIAREGVEWDGIRDPAAHDLLRQMRAGDGAILCHAGDQDACVGVMKVTRAWRPDGANGEWGSVAITPAGQFPHPVTMAEIAAEPSLARIEALRRPDLAITPLRDGEWEVLLAMGVSFWSRIIDETCPELLDPPDGHRGPWFPSDRKRLDLKLAYARWAARDWPGDVELDPAVVAAQAAIAAYDAEQRASLERMPPPAPSPPCPECGAKTRAGARFCVSCGTTLGDGG